MILQNSCQPVRRFSTHPPKEKKQTKQKNKKQKNCLNLKLLDQKIHIEMNTATSKPLMKKSDIKISEATCITCKL